MFHVNESERYAWIHDIGGHQNWGICLANLAKLLILPWCWCWAGVALGCRSESGRYEWIQDTFRWTPTKRHIALFLSVTRQSRRVCGHSIVESSWRKVVLVNCLPETPTADHTHKTLKRVQGRAVAGHTQLQCRCSQTQPVKRATLLVERL